MIKNSKLITGNNYITQNTTSILFDKWTDYSYPLHNKILTPIHINNALIELWKIFNLIPDTKEVNHFIQIQFKVKTDSGLNKSISYLQIINKDDFNALHDSFIEFWNLKGSYYYSSNVSNINFTYKIFNSETSKEIKNNNISRLNNNIVSLYFVETGKKIVPFNTFKLFRKSINKYGEINLIVFDDLIYLSLKPILSLENNLLNKLSFNKNSIRSVYYTSIMLYDLMRSPHCFILREFLLEELSSNTITITTNKINNKNSILDKDARNFTNTFFEFKDLSNNELKISGIYLINYNNEIYIGSSINIKNRFKTHHLPIFKEPNRSDLKFKILYITTNYFDKFKSKFKNYKLSKGEWKI